ncbi:SWIM zinc finger family protein [Desertivirga arenae]|uniref:SWIM zinc finger family protein n=1 Tax=Desertivirga arenae TaxID=2810309 RepID=UPI001A9758B5|nr:SWIM zinc finger family protein [Pedobacter sp. SYSU D00823]
MTETLTYQYHSPSIITKSHNEAGLFLSNYSEIQKKDNPCFFFGNLRDPYITAQALITLSNVVQSSFNLSPFQLALLKDPIVTSGNEKIRFEGFSHCAGVYARVDILESGLDGEFPEPGTTNVDFNQPMISSLSSIERNEKVVLSVGAKELDLIRDAKITRERKVPLPVKWIKALTSVQTFLADSEYQHGFNKIQSIQLFKTLPPGKPKSDYYLISRAGKASFSPVKSGNAICIGGVHRLRLLEPLLPFIDQLKVFAHPNMQSTSWQLYFGSLRFSLTLSRDPWRGFSGEGAALDSLLEDIPDSWLSATHKFCYANQQFNSTLFAVNEGIHISLVNQLTTRLSAMGLLGFDLDENSFFYRRLPFKTERILNLNPRLKDAEKLLAEGNVRIQQRETDKVEARVKGSGVDHVVVINNGKERCTCTWFSRNQGERGSCKHILAVKKKISEL